MDGFFTALLQHTFLQTAVATALLASVGCGIMGSYVVVKRIAFIAGGYTPARQAPVAKRARSAGQNPPVTTTASGRSR